MSSYLFVPGNTPGMLQTAEVFGAEGIIFDLEDAIASSDKDSALDLVHSFLEINSLPNAFVRINDFNKSGKKELEYLDNLSLKGYVIPKATKHVMEEIATVTDKELIALIESPLGVLELEEIAKIPQVIGLLLGGEDLALELHAIRSKDDVELMYAKQKLVLVAAAHNLISIDTPCTNVKDEDLLQDRSKDARAMGFSAKAAIHPNHVHIINKAFQPTDEEVLFAEKVIQTAENNASGVFSVDGKMVDLPVLLRAKQTLLTRKKYEALLNNR